MKGGQSGRVGTAEQQAGGVVVVVVVVMSPLCNRDSFFSPMILGPNICYLTMSEPMGPDFLTMGLFS
jgi:hypothetical protein